MHQTFMSIHSKPSEVPPCCCEVPFLLNFASALTSTANILFASDSITDILDYDPDDVFGTSLFDYFHPDELSDTRLIYERGIILDQAAVLHYARIRAQGGHWVSCECVFTVVYDVLIASISVYREGERSQGKAEAMVALRVTVRIATLTLPRPGSASSKNSASFLALVSRSAFRYTYTRQSSVRTRGSTTRA